MEATLSQASIRPYRASDVPAIQRHLNSWTVTCNMIRVPFPYTLADAEWWVQRCASEPVPMNFAITHDDEVIGGLGFELADPERKSTRRHVAEIGYWLAEPFWGRGLATEAVGALTAWGWAKLDLQRIEANVFARNGASARVLAKNGFQLEGRLRATYLKDGEYLDGLLFAKVQLPPA